MCLNLLNQQFEFKLNEEETNMTEFGGRRPYTASGPGAQQDRINHNLQRAESLLDEPDTGFSLGANYGGQGFGAGAGGSGSGGNSGIGSGIGGRLGTAGQASNPVGSYMGRSQYTASDIDSDSHSQVQARPRFGAGDNHGGGALADITEIGTVEVAGSRRGRRFAGGTSQHSGSQYNQGIPSNRLQAQNSGYEGDILDNEINRNDAMQKKRSTNLLSDAGSKGYQDDDDLMSHYMNQSAYGGASNIGVDVASNAGDRYTQHGHQTSQQPAAVGTSERGSRRREVAARNNLNIGSGGDAGPRRNDRLAGGGSKQPETRNYGLFLGGSAGPGADNTSSQGVRSKSEHARALGEQGNTIDSRESAGGFKRLENPNTGVGTSFARQFPPSRPAPFDVQKDDAVSATSKEQPRSIISSPGKADAISIVDNKKEYLRAKKKKDLEALEQELEREKRKLEKTDDDFQKEIERLKEKQQRELDSVEQSQRGTLEMLSQEKDKIMGTLHEAVERERSKMEQLHRADLEAKDKLHQENLQSLKAQLEKETHTLESQLDQQHELRGILERVQKRTVDIAEIVQSSLRQREDELKRREIEMAKLERDMLEDETIQIELEEKKLTEEERKLQSRKDVLLKLKQTQNEEINRLREQRQNAIANNQKDEARLRQEERNAKESLAMTKKKLEQENERRSAQNRLIEVELQNKESEAENANQLLEKEKAELEQEQRENYIRDIQSKQIEIEDRKKALANNEHELRRQQRLLEKKAELIQADREQLEERQLNFNAEKVEFEVLAQQIQATSERLQEEREKVLEEKAVFDLEKEQLDRIKHDIDIERSLLQAEFMRTEELEHELIHRDNMLKMLQFNKDHKDKINHAGGLLPPYTSCPNLKMENLANGIQTLSPGGEHYDRQQFTSAAPAQPMEQAPQFADIQATRFDYNRYMQELQAKLGDYTMFSGARNQNRSNFSNNMSAQVDEFAQQVGYQGGQINEVVSEDEQQLSPTNDYVDKGLDQSRGIHSSVTKSGRGFREKILAQLGNAQLEDSKFNSNSEGFQDDNEISGDMFNRGRDSQEYADAKEQNFGGEMDYDSEV